LLSHAYIFRLQFAQKCAFYASMVIIASMSLLTANLRCCGRFDRCLLRAAVKSASPPPPIYLQKPEPQCHACQIITSKNIYAAIFAPYHDDAQCCPVSHFFNIFGKFMTLRDRVLPVSNSIPLWLQQISATNNYLLKRKHVS
jgi:hypothetical protein